MGAPSNAKTSKAFLWDMQQMQNKDAAWVCLFQLDRAIRGSMKLITNHPTLKHDVNEKAITPQDASEMGLEGSFL